LRGWIRLAQKEVSDDECQHIGNIPTLTVLHAHLALILSTERSPENNIDFLASISFVRANHSYGQQFCNDQLDLEQHNTNISVIEDIVSKQLIKFLQSQGVVSSNIISKAHLKTFLTGDPVYFVTENSSIRVPLVGISTTQRGFEAPPCEVPESLLSYVWQRHSERLTSWIQSLSYSSLNRILCHVVRVALCREDLLSSSSPSWKQVSPYVYATSYKNDNDANLKFDVRRALVTCNNFEIRPIPNSMSSFSDFEQIFGQKIVHCVESSIHERCQSVIIVGSSHTLSLWDKPLENKDQGVGVPSPVPSLAFSNPFGMPSRQTVKNLLFETVFINNTLKERVGDDTDDHLIGLFFGMLYLFLLARLTSSQR